MLRQERIICTKCKGWGKVNEDGTVFPSIEWVYDSYFGRDLVDHGELIKCDRCVNGLEIIVVEDTIAYNPNWL